MNRLPPFALKPRSSTVSTRMPRLNLARIGFSAASNASSVIDSSVMRTGTMRFGPKMNSGSGACEGAISMEPAEASAFAAASCRLLGYTMVSMAASCGCRPNCTACASLPSSESVASISASTLIVSMGGPFRRSASSMSPDSCPAARICSERVSVSGLYCRAMMRSTPPLAASISTRPPRSSRGEPGNALIARPHPFVGSPIPLPSRWCRGLAGR